MSTEDVPSPVDETEAPPEKAVKDVAAAAAGIAMVSWLVVVVLIAVRLVGRLS